MTSSLEVLRSHAIYINPSFSEKPIKIPSQMYPLTGTQWKCLATATHFHFPQV